jgi:hypothetical protein
MCNIQVHAMWCVSTLFSTKLVEFQLDHSIDYRNEIDAFTDIEKSLLTVGVNLERESIGYRVLTGIYKIVSGTDFGSIRPQKWPLSSAYNF